MPHNLVIAQMMKIVRYKKTEFLIPWKWPKKNPLYRFYFGYSLRTFTFPLSRPRESLNEMLIEGSVLPY